MNTFYLTTCEIARAHTRRRRIEDTVGAQSLYEDDDRWFERLPSNGVMTHNGTRNVGRRNFIADAAFAHVITLPEATKFAALGHIPGTTRGGFSQESHHRDLRGARTQNR